MAVAVNLTSADLTKLSSSGIPAELAAQAQLRRVESREGGALVGRNGSGDYAGVVFPYIWPGETAAREYRLRRDHPEIEYKDGKPRERDKYLTPPGRSNLLYFVPGTSPEWVTDPSIPAVITEGEKKTLGLWVTGWEGLGDSAEVPAFLPIGLSGVWNWRGTIGKTNGPDGDRRSVKGIIPDFQRVAWKGRRVTILFDTNVGDSESVQGARAGLTQELRRVGAEVFWFTWPEDTPEGVNGIDDLVGLWGAAKVRKLIRERVRPVKLTSSEYQASAREFAAVGEDHYRLTVPALGITFDVDRLRREHHELIGELGVKCELPGARTVVGSTLSIADFNFSSARARSDRAKMLAERANTKDLDWGALVEEFAQRVLQADRVGLPAVDLRELPRPDTENDTVEIEGLPLLRRHPSVIFGDGGAAKSYTALFLAGRMAQMGIRAALFDWELCGEDHRERLERLFGARMPPILYARCERPLVFEADRLRRIVRENGIEFCVFDSVAFACDGPPESAEVAGRYFRAVRQIGGGSLHIAHVNKGENADQKPFGSAFWHNGARSTWYAQRAEDLPDGSIIRLGLFNRKTNLGALRQPASFTVTFTDGQTIFRRANIADSPELATKLTVAQRMTHLLRRGSMTVKEIAENLEIEPNTITQTLNRNLKKNRIFIVLDGKDTDRRIGLLAQEKAS
jgi:DNA-binding CsgD family transcriptional regulator